MLVQHYIMIYGKIVVVFSRLNSGSVLEFIMIVDGIAVVCSSLLELSVELCARSLVIDCR